MINPQVVEYIKKQLQIGDYPGKIKTDLLANGWSTADVDEAFSSINSPEAPQPQNYSTPVHTPQTPNSRTWLTVVLVILIVVLLGGGGVFAYNMFYAKKAEVNPEVVQQIENPATTVDNEATQVAQDAPVASNPTPAPVNTSNSSTSSVTVDLWSIFDQSTLALKNADVAAYNKVVYDQIPPEESSHFASFAPFLYEEASKTNKAAYIHKWQDDKQAIYTTNPVKRDDEKTYGYSRSSIMFINSAGSWKILVDAPDRGWNVSKSGTNKTAAQVEADLQAMMLDTDKDGLTDQEETCTGGQAYNPKCVKSDPAKRDTNGNGYWDGIEAKMK